MIKELILAIVLGALLGFGVTGSILTLRQSKNQKSTNPPAITTPAPTTQANTTVTPTAPPSTITSDFVVTSPTNESIVANSKIEITGTTTPKNLVVAKTPIDDYYTLADDSGNFNLNVELESGVNLILVTSINSETNIQVSNTIIVTYSTAKF